MCLCMGAIPPRGLSDHRRCRSVRGGAGIAYGGANLDPDGHVEVAHEALDHERLLEVLLTEIGGVRPAHVEQLRDDGRDAAEMAGAAAPSGAAQYVGHSGHLDCGREPV